MSDPSPTSTEEQDVPQAGTATESDEFPTRADERSENLPSTEQSEGVDDELGAVAPGGQTKAEIIDQSTSVNPYAGSPIVGEEGDDREPRPAGEAKLGEPQRIQSQSERIADAGEDAPTQSGIDNPNDIEDAVRDEQRQQREEWREPETLSTQADVTPPIHAADTKPGGRLSELAEGGDVFGDSENTRDIAAEVRDREDKRRQEAEQSLSDALDELEGNNETPDTQDESTRDESIDPNAAGGNPNSGDNSDTNAAEDAQRDETAGDQGVTPTTVPES